MVSAVLKAPVLTKYDKLKREKVDNEILEMKYFRSFIHYYEYHNGNRYALDLNYVLQALGLNAFNEVAEKIGMKV